MKQELQITKEEAIKLYPDASPAIKSIFESTFGVETFKPKKITDRIQTLEDVYGMLGLYSAYPIPSPADKVGKAVVAFKVLLNVVKAYNEGWEPDWNNSSQYKYYPYFYKASDGWRSVCYYYWPSHCGIPSGLLFKSSELALDAINKFRSLYEDYYMIS